MDPKAASAFFAGTMSQRSMLVEGATAALDAPSNFEMADITCMVALFPRGICGLCISRPVTAAFQTLAATTNNSSMAAIAGDFGNRRAWAGEIASLEGSDFEAMASRRGAIRRHQHTACLQ